MGKSQRTKGAVGEREVCDIFSAALGLADGPCFCEHSKSQHIVGGENGECGASLCVCRRYKNKLAITRNIGQARDGGNDIDIEDLVVEVKRRKTLGTVYGWLQQAYKAALNTSRPEGFVGEGWSFLTRGTPIVVCRQDGGEWIVVLRLTDFIKYWLGWRKNEGK